MAEVLKMRFLVRSRTKAAWTALNEILLASVDGTGAREMGLEEDTGRYKLGDGVTPWNDLPYHGDAAPSLGFVAETSSTTAADPGAGAVKWAHATQSSAAHLYLSGTAVDGVDLEAFLGELGATGFLQLVSANDNAKWQLWKWTSVSDNTGWWTLAVDYLAGSGAFADGEALRAGFVSAGGANYVAGPGIAIDTSNPAAPIISSTVGAIALSGSPSTYAGLPGGLGSGDAGKAYLVTGEDMIYVWSGSAFPAQGAGLSAGSKVRTVIKAADQSRASVGSGGATTDAELFMTLQPGTYRIELDVYFDRASGSDLNHYVAPSFSGSGSVIGFRRRYTQTGVTSTDNESTRSGGGSSLPGQMGSTGIAATGASPGNYNLVGVLVATSAGIFSLDWAQNTSSATASIVRMGSMLRVTKA